MSSLKVNNILNHLNGGNVNFSNAINVTKIIQDFENLYDNLPVDAKNVLNNITDNSKKIPKNIELKRTYCPKLNRIRIIEVKGRTCTVEIEIGSGYKTTETRVSIASLVGQVKHYNIL